MRKKPFLKLKLLSSKIYLVVPTSYSKKNFRQIFSRNLEAATQNLIIEFEFKTFFMIMDGLLKNIQMP